MPGLTFGKARHVRVCVILAVLCLTCPIIAHAQNPIVTENALPGTPCSQWDLSSSCDGAPGDASIVGFTTDISVNKGQTVYFKIKTSSTEYRLDIYRMGYYQGNGARLIQTIVPDELPQIQPECAIDPSVNLVDCGTWAVSAHWDIPATATSGIYFAKLVSTNPAGRANHIPFIVRDDARPSDILFKTSDLTWQAYNSYGGASIYAAHSPLEPKPGGQGAYKVSYNRPFVTRENIDVLGKRSFLFNAEYPLVRWLEFNGFDVAYMSSVDLDRGSVPSLLTHKAFLSVGHDEYWSGPSPAETNGNAIANPGMRANLAAAIDGGLNVAFLSGNEVYWKTRWEKSLYGQSTAYRTLVCYKETWDNQRIDPVSNVWTGTWRDARFNSLADGGQPENALTGVLWTVNGPDYRPLVIPAEKGKLRFWRNTPVYSSASLGADTELPNGIIGHEWDEAVDNAFRPAGLVALSSSPYLAGPVLYSWGWPSALNWATHALTFFRRPNGGLVFAAGTVQWSWGLDDTHDRDSFAPACCQANVNAQQATVNLLADMGVQPGTLAPSLTVAQASSDTTAPASTITSPVGPWTLQGNNLLVSGTASDVGGRVGGVEISIDGGQTWHPAVGHESWHYTTVVTKPGTTTIVSRAVDDSGNLGQPSAGVTGIVQMSQGDFDNNGHVDLVLTNQTDTTQPYGSARVAYLSGSGGNTNIGVDWLSPSQSGEPAGWRVVGAADFNRDGYTDLLWFSVNTGQATIWYMGGTNGTQLQSWKYVENGSSEADWVVATVADFDRDGVPDIVWMNQATRQARIWHMDAVDGSTRRDWTWIYYGTDQSGQSMAAVQPGWTITTAMDFDRDGVPDLVWLNDSTRVASVWFMGGLGGAYSNCYTFIVIGHFPRACSPDIQGAIAEPGWKLIGAADFNGDGRGDIVWRNDANQTSTVWYMGGPMGTEFQAWDWLNGTAPGWAVTIPTTVPR
jgi:hypothetical protein